MKKYKKYFTAMMVSGCILFSVFGKLGFEAGERSAQAAVFITEKKSAGESGRKENAGAVKKNAKELAALKKMIKTQKAKGADMPGPSDSTAYTWKGGHLVKVKIPYLADLHGKISFQSFPELKVFSCGNGIHLTALDFSKNKKLVSLYCSDGGTMESYESGKIKTLDISGCVSLKKLDCSNNMIKKLNVRKCTQLEKVNCSKNDLKELDMRSCKKLKALDCSFNWWIRKLDVTACAKLEKLDCQSNSLKKLNVTKNVKLKKLSCMYNQLKTLNLTKNTALTELSTDVRSTTLDVRKNTELKRLYCQGGSYKQLNLSKNTKLEVLDINSEHLTALDVSKNPALKKLRLCAVENCDALDVSKNKTLKVLDCYGAGFDSLKLNGADALEHLRYEDGRGTLKTLDVSGNPALKKLECFRSGLKTLDVSKNPRLKELSCESNALQELDISGNPALKILGCASNGLKKLVLGENSALKKLHCGENELSELHVENASALEDLNCEKNCLTSLDVSANPALQVLNCASNSLSALEVGKKTGLQNLNCAENQLTNLDVSGIQTLKEVYCGKNQLETLHVSGDTALETLDCTENALTELEVGDCAALENLFCCENALTVLDVSKNKKLNSLMTDSEEDGKMQVIGDVTLKKEDFLEYSEKKGCQFDFKNYDVLWQMENGYDASDGKMPEEEKARLNAFPIVNAGVKGGRVSENGTPVFEAGNRIDFSVTISDRRSEEEKQNDIVKNSDNGFENRIVDVILQLRSEESDQRVFVKLRLKKQTKDGTVTAKGGFTAGSGMQSGKWIVASIVVNPARAESENQALVTYVNRHCNGNQEYPDLSWGDFTVQGTKGDLSAPVMKDYKAKKNKDGTVTLRFRAEDESGVRAYVWTSFDTGDSYEEIAEKNGVFTLTRNASFLDYDKNYPAKIYLTDQWGNSYTFDQTAKKSSKEWEKELLAGSSITFKSIAVEPARVPAGKKCKVTVKMTLTKFTPEKVYVRYNSPFDDAYMDVILEKEKKESSLWKGDFQTKSTALKGAWRPYALVAEGKNSEGQHLEFDFYHQDYVTEQRANVRDSWVDSVAKRVSFEGGEIVVE